MIQDYSKYDMKEKERILFYSSGFFVIAAIIFLFYRSFILSGAGGLLIILLKPYYEKYRVRMRMQKLTVQFKDMLCSISSSIASGRQMSEAIVEASDDLALMYDSSEPIMVELCHMKRSITENNETDRVLLTDFAERSKNEDINNFAQVYVTCRSLGGDMEKIVTHTAVIITEKMNIEREIKALTAQKKLEGRIIALMPVIMLLALNVFSPAYIAPLYAGMAGRLIMSGCFIVLLLGVWMMEKISAVEI